MAYVACTKTPKGCPVNIVFRKYSRHSFQFELYDIIGTTKYPRKFSRMFSRGKRLSRWYHTPLSDALVPALCRTSKIPNDIFCEQHSFIALPFRHTVTEHRVFPMGSLDPVRELRVAVSPVARRPSGRARERAAPLVHGSVKPIVTRRVVCRVGTPGHSALG